MQRVTMPQATQAAFDARIELDESEFAETGRIPAAAINGISIKIYGDPSAIEAEWRAFEQFADCTVFQSYDWVSAWLRHIGRLSSVLPAIVTGRDTNGRLLFLFPLAIERGALTRRLTWLGSDLCDYNGPLLAPEFGARIDGARFKMLWRDVCRKLRTHPQFRFDVVHFHKMQASVGSQPNPFIGLGVIPHANGAYLTALGSDWESFYQEKRSSATRRRDRTKRKRLGEFGEVRFATATDVSDLAATLDTLMNQKAKSFAAMGVTNIFGLPGYREFYGALSQMHGFVHVSRLEVGAQTAAANLGLIFRGSYYHLLASYDGGELSKHGPGAAHLHHLLQYAIEKSCRNFDFTIGDERYKQEWCDGHIALFDHVAPATLRGCVAAAALYATSRVKHLIKQTPAMWNAASRIRATLGLLVQRVRG
jgi:CelD/BcsL family acetyltransferase involved in cellulose biosynthesis